MGGTVRKEKLGQTAVETNLLVPLAEQQGAKLFSLLSPAECFF